MRSVTNLGPLSLWQCLTHKLRSTYRYQAHCVVLHTVLFLSFPNASCAYIYDIYIYCIHLESQIRYDYKLWTNKRKEKNQRSTTSGHSRPKPSWGVEDGDEDRNSSVFFMFAMKWTRLFSSRSFTGSRGLQCSFAGNGLMQGVPQVIRPRHPWELPAAQY